VCTPTVRVSVEVSGHVFERFDCQEAVAVVAGVDAGIGGMAGLPAATLGQLATGQVCAVALSAGGEIIINGLHPALVGLHPTCGMGGDILTRLGARPDP